MLSHSNLLFAARSGATLRAGRAGRPGVRRVADLARVRPRFGRAEHAVAGAALHLVPRFTAEGFATALAVDGVSIVPGVPAMYARLLDYARRSGKAIAAPRARFLYAGGAPLDPQLKADVERAFDQPLHNGYGLTETSPSVASTRIDSPRADLSIGPPVPGIEVRIVDGGGRAVAPGEVGELHIRGPNVMLGYYRAPELTAEVVSADGWFNTGDLARADAEGQPLHRRTQQGADHPLRIQRLPGGGRGCPHPASGCPPVRGRRARRTRERGGDRVRRAARSFGGDPRRARGIRGGAARALQTAGRRSPPAALPASATGKVLKSALREREAKPAT